MSFAKTGLGWLGKSKELTIEYCFQNSPYSLSLSGFALKSNNSNIYLNSAPSNYTEYRNDYLDGSIGVSLIRNITLQSSKNNNVKLNTSPFVRLSYLYRKGTHIQNDVVIVSNDKKVNREYDYYSRMQTGEIEIGIRPEVIFFQKVSLLFFMGISGSLQYGLLNNITDTYDISTDVHFFGDLFKNSGDFTSALGSISIVYWFGKK
jgi:hypothetical protein